MRNAATLFARVMVDVFTCNPASHAATAGNANTAGPAKSPNPASADTHSSTSHVVGQGASNETIVTIGDIPHLFVDEGDHIVEFTPAFDDHAEETEFGLKIVPDLVPHWSQRSVHRCALKEAVAVAIRQNGKPPTAMPLPPGKGTDNDSNQASQSEVQETFEPEARASNRPRRTHNADESNVIGRIVSWGEERFPDRKRPGRHYTSFAVHIDTSAGERTLQGEGLKEAIAECGCVLGDVVSVRRTGKVKVPAIRQTDGTPIMKDGKPLMWDKWLWSISK
ncbi:hypothetical protein QYH69_22315 [Paraburkholderia sp. SARCC-3016]|uniref:hypothetical protein n=1 Tax=Paraburkholderia sp. SARCC-3016 TaxID=3058611 RepID=UPI0028099F9C|nr:hypothetical protein [Paraburkholderia sp. SARCC-3016]MDQ7979980.1 hypothetical protein [Paraburkholderia sp. SARCC-3016]